MMQLGFYFDQSRCTGCFTCCVACKDWHDISAGPIRWVRVDTIEEGKFPDPFVAHIFSPCYQCEDPSCLKACPADAIVKRKEDGIVTVNQEECLGEDSCGAPCKDACPYGSPQFGDEESPRMQKCDLCREQWQEGKKPICVEACPMRALDAGPLSELKKKYGELKEGTGFVYSSEIKPSIIFKPKKNNIGKP
ncbi:MAG: 4Fe-4S dicluster domain-containing protein [Deltaproteobacteria bacterium]|nr:MAG: 4Fe-4S dicluster domain-containing protein [Deltaproteobacteria bacterium]